MARSAIRARLLDFAGDPTFSPTAVRQIDDGLLLIEDGRIVGRGEFSALSRALAADEQVIDHSDCLLLPGFIDTHTHFAQIDVIAATATDLFDWLERHTYPVEERFADSKVCAEAASFFLDELANQGTTSACVLGTVHPQSVEALFVQAQARGMRLVSGKCLMDRNCPRPLRDTADRSLQDSLELAARWHGQGRLAYAITPRFAASSTALQLQLAGELARARPDLYVQSHLAETESEVRWIRKLYPQARSYLDVYDRAGLLRELSVFAHCIWLDDADRARFAQSGAVVAACPSSNLFLGSGRFDFGLALQAGMPLTLGTDVGGGQSLSMLATMRAARDVAASLGKQLRATQLFYWATRGAAEALGWNGKVGVLEPGAEADFVVLDPAATPLLARRTTAAQSVESLLCALMILGDDRCVRETYIAGQASKRGRTALQTTAARPQTNDVRANELTRRFMGRMQNAPGVDGNKR